jgi:hypothetical protein
MQYICSHKQARSGHDPLRSAHGPLTVSSRFSHGQGKSFPVLKRIRSYKRSRSAHGQLTVSSRLSHVNLRPGKIIVYMSASVHTNGHGHVTRRSTKRECFQNTCLTELNTVTVKPLPVKFLSVFEAKWSALHCRQSFQCASLPTYVTVSLPWSECEGSPSVD